MNRVIRILASLALVALPSVLFAQRYSGGLVDKTVAVVGNEMISLSDIESEVTMARAQGQSSDRNMRCELLENVMMNKLFLMQARLDSLEINSDVVERELQNRLDQVRTSLGGDDIL